MFLCEFIYFNSLQIASEREHRGSKLEGLFFHCPTRVLEKDIQSGRDVMIHVIKEVISLE